MLALKLEAINFKKTLNYSLLGYEIFPHMQLHSIAINDRKFSILDTSDI
jgi:hypothetical protein